MRIFLARFFKQNSGAVSAELVVLTMACVATTVALLLSLTDHADALGDQIGEVVAAAVVGTEDEEK